jgi:hypothetical protein
MPSGLPEYRLNRHFKWRSPGRAATKSSTYPWLVTSLQSLLDDIMTFRW